MADDLYERIAAASASHVAKDDRTTTLIFSCRVADFDHWLEGYEKAVAADSQMLAHRIWRSQDDSNKIVVAETFPSRSYPQEATADPATAEAMERDGIDMASVQFDFYDEVSAWTR